MKIYPKSWDEFQHYKERNPVWIKLHKKLLDDFEFQSLPVASRALAPMLWLIASEDKTGLINAEERKLAFRLRTTPAEIRDGLKPLIDAGFFIVEHGDSGPLAEPEHQDSPETETQVKTEEEKEILPVTTGRSKPYPEDFEKFWKAYPTDSNMPKKQAFKAWSRLTPEKRCAALGAVPGFKAYCAANSWYRPIYADRFLSQEKFEGYASQPMPSAEEIEANRDRADKLFKRGKYAEVYQ